MSTTASFIVNASTKLIPGVVSDLLSFNLVNNFRRENGKPAIDWDPSLYAIALGMPDDMAKANGLLRGMGTDKIKEIPNVRSAVVYSCETRGYQL